MVAADVLGVDQMDDIAGAPGGGEEVGHVVGFTLEHALTAVASQDQAIELGSGSGGRDLLQLLVEHLALVEQAALQGIGDVLPLVVADALAAFPETPFELAVGPGQHAHAGIGEVAAVDTGVAVGEHALTVEFPVAEGAAVLAAIAADEFAVAGQLAGAEATAPEVAPGAAIDAGTLELVVDEFAVIAIAAWLLPLANPIEVAIVEGADGLGPVAVQLGALTLHAAIDEAAVVFPAAAADQIALAVVEAAAKGALVVGTVGELLLARAFGQAILEAPLEPVAIGPLDATATVEQTADDLAGIDPAIGQPHAARVGRRLGDAGRQQQRGEGETVQEGAHRWGRRAP